MTNTRGSVAVVAEQRETAAANVVNARLGLPVRTLDKSEWETFRAWAAEKQLPALPARPATVAMWVLDSKHLGADRILAVLESVSATHAPNADPTLGLVVSSALNQVVGTAPPPPRSWSKADKARWPELPYDLQREIAPREALRSAEMRRLQNELATLKKVKPDGCVKTVTDQA